MRATSLQLQNFRSFASMDSIELDQINVLIGPNNAGKSSVLKALHLIQEGGGNIYPDVRVNANHAKVGIGLKDMQGEFDFKGSGFLSIQVESTDRNIGNIRLMMSVTDGRAVVQQLPSIEPHHFIVPYLSKRKTTYYQEEVKNENALRVSTDMSNLAAKLTRIATPGFPNHESYREACEAILGFMVG
jgi:predicted ATP-dependent endonuclease of OLD family